MAIVASLCLLRAHGVREVRAESLTAVTFFGDRLLLRVNPLAILILRGHQYRASRSHRSVSLSGHGAVTPKQKNVVSQSLKIVRGPVPKVRLALVVKHRALLIGLHLQVTAVTTGRPRKMAGVASHAAVGMRELRFIVKPARRHSPRTIVLANRLGERGLLVVVGVALGDRVHHLLDLPDNRLALFVV